MGLPGMKTNRGSVLGGIGKINVKPGMALGVIILAALLAFEMFNYSTTEYALRDLLGDLRFAGMRWATILAAAFCGIDFAGIARLFTPEQETEETKGIWYLFGAWLLAATMNAMLTWWGVSMAIVTHNVQSAAVISTNMLTKVVPAFVALLVWVIRILIIGSLSVAGDRLVMGTSRRRVSGAGAPVGGMRPAYNPGGMRPASGSLSAAGRGRGGMTVQAPSRPGAVELPEGRPEPSYHSLSGAGERSGGAGANPLFRKF